MMINWHGADARNFCTLRRVIELHWPVVIEVCLIFLK
jgi:hypothetical protein